MEKKNQIENELWDVLLRFALLILLFLAGSFLGWMEQQTL